MNFLYFFMYFFSVTGATQGDGLGGGQDVEFDGGEDAE
jgi:hypothetical protein